MKKEIAAQIEGYDEVLAEVEAVGKYGSDYQEERGRVAAYIQRLHPRKLYLTVNEIITESASTKTFRLTPAKGFLPPFLAGQYISVFTKIGPIRTGRPYSISSPPNQRGYYDITIRRVPDGLVSGWFLNDVEIGQVITTSGPQGNFYHNPLVHAPSMVCLAGGSGITPFMSMIREITECGLERELKLIYGCRSDVDIPFHEELTRLARKHSNITYVPVVEKPGEDFLCKQGLIDEDIIRDVSGNLEYKSFFLCGPQGLYAFCLPILEEMGIPRRRIRREMYGPPLDITREPGWPTKITADTHFIVTIGEKQIQARAGSPLIRTLEDEGLVVPSLCRSGECSMCRVKVTKGEVFQPAGAAVRSSDRQFGYVHSCVAYPLADIEIVL